MNILNIIIQEILTHGIFALLGFLIGVLGGISTIASLLRGIFITKTIPIFMKKILELEIDILTTSLRPFLVPYKMIFIIARINVILSAGLYRTIHNVMEQATTRKDSRSTALGATIAGMLVRSRAAANTRSYCLLLCAMLVYLCTYLLDYVPINSGPIIVLSLLLIGLYANQWVLEYRIRKGFYGFNAYEAREIISFILSHSNKSDFSDTDGLKAILPDAEMDKTYERLHNLLPEYVS